MKNSAQRMRPTGRGQGLDGPLQVGLASRVLTETEERELSAAAAKGDKQSRDRLIEANLRLVVVIARGYQGCGLPMEDLVGEGTLGLIRAIDRFDPAYGRRLSIYASHWIRMTIRQALSETASTIRLPSYMAKLLGRWQRVEREVARELGDVPNDEATAAAMGLGSKKLAHVRDARAARSLRSGAVPGTDDDQVEHCPDPGLPAALDRLALNEDLDILRARFGMLKPCERLVLTVRYGLDGSDPLSLAEIGRRLEISGEWVRRTESRAIQRLTRLVTQPMAAVEAPTTDQDEDVKPARSRRARAAAPVGVGAGH